MADLRIDFAGIKAPEPVLARLGAADRQGLQCRARLRGRLGRRGLEDAGRGRPPIVNVNGPRYGAHRTRQDRRVLGFNNIELITDRPLEVNLREITRGQARLARPGAGRLADGAVRRAEPGRRSWPRVEDTGATASSSTSAARTACASAAWARPWARCPNTSRWSTRWCKQHTPHAGDRQAHAQHHRHPPAGARAAKRGGADAVSLINTINSIMGVDLDAHDARARRPTATAPTAAIAARR